MTNHNLSCNLKRILAIVSIFAIAFSLVMSTFTFVNAEEVTNNEEVVLEEDRENPEKFCWGDQSPFEGTFDSTLVKITSQPKNVSVMYPDEASFEVVVDNPGNVDSYQWYLVDSKSNVFRLDGASAKTSKLILPSTQQTMSDLQFYCIIKDNEGKSVKSDSATITITNSKTDITVLYILGYALTAGESLDLSTCKDVAGNGIGTGNVSFDANGIDITFENLDINNEYMEFDHALISGPGIVLDRYLNMQPEYRIHLVGTNKIVNTYFEEDFNQGGITFDLLCYGEDESRVDPKITIDGDGSLDLTGGTYAFRKFMGDLYINSDITTHVIYKDEATPIYSKGIVSEYDDLYINPGVALNLNTAASALSSRGYLEIKDADVNIVTDAARVSVGATFYDGIKAGAGMVLEDSNINIDYYARNTMFSMTGDYPNTSVAGLSFAASDPRALYNSSIKNCNVDISLVTDDPIDEDYFANSYDGIYAGKQNNLEISDSEIDIDIYGKAINNAYGIHSNAENGNKAIIKNSNVNIDVDVNYSPYGIMGTTLDIVDSAVNAEVNCEYNIYRHRPVAIYATSALNIDLSKKDNLVSGKAIGGTAIAVKIGTADGAKEYNPDYKAQRLSLSDTTRVATPKKFAISTSSYQVENAKKIVYGAEETFYDLSDTSKPADTVKLTSNYVAPNTGDSSNLVLYIALTAGAVIAIVVLLIIRRKNR